MVEFEEGRRIAWRPAEPGKSPPGHLWRWELEPAGPSSTRVTCTYDWTQLTTLSACGEPGRPRPASSERRLAGSRPRRGTLTAAARRPPQDSMPGPGAGLARRARPERGDSMRAKVFFITLAVDDLGRSLAFYWDDLGWPTQGVAGQEFHDELTGADGTIAIFTLDDGLTLMLYERANLAKDASLPAGPAQLHRVQPRHPRRVPRGGRPAAHPGPGRRRHRHRTRPHAPVRRVLWLLHDLDGHLFEIARNSSQ